MRFSQRIGIVPVRDVIQKDSMDEPLRNGLWNALECFYWSRVDQVYFEYKVYDPYKLRVDDRGFDELFSSLWVNHFKVPLNDLPTHWTGSGFTTIGVYRRILDYFFGCKWHEVYDFVEFVPNNYNSKIYSSNIQNDKFRSYCNLILERELSAYRFVDGIITQITSEEEIRSIEEALEPSDAFRPVTIHLKRALELFSDRSNPDYRNSIKESISAVEALCKLVVGDEKATLGEAIKKVGGIHPALRGGFEKIYGYSSDADGIRHALMDDAENLKSEDAKFMLVACSAFANYLKVKQDV